MRRISAVQWGALCGFLAVAVCSACAAGAGKNATVPAGPERELCKAARPQMCMEIYLPVCGYTPNGAHKTYANSCLACADAKVERYVTGKCAGE